MEPLAEFNPAAREEFDEAFDWYAKRSREAAARFAAAVDVAIDAILQAPERFATTSAGCRFARTKRYPYLVIFRQSTRGVVVVAIAHSRRRPGYWKSRTEDH
jgi:plasmid stabilization system protein ParE